MIFNAMLLLLGAITFLQGHNAAPYEDMESASQALRIRLNVRKLAMTESNNILLVLVKEGKPAMEKMLNDQKVLEIKSDLMKLKLDDIREVIKKFENFEQKSPKEAADYREITDEFQRLTAEFGMRTNPGKRTKEDEVIAESLLKNGFVRYSLPVQERVQAFSDVVCAELEKYFNGLNETGKQNESAVFAVIEKLKAEPNTEKRSELIINFVEDSELDKFLW